MVEQFKYLFMPIKIGPVTVRNRIVSTPHGTRFNASGVPTERLAYYHAERAKGGVGLIEIEGIEVAPEAPDTPQLSEYYVLGYNEACIPGFRRVAEMVHQYGAKVFCELMCLASWAGRAPSAIPDLMTRSTPHEATIDEIESWVRGFGITARNLREAGLDGVEIHASHGAGVQQFNSPLYNRRTDKYGGSLEKRLTFLLESIASIRSAVGHDLALGVRLDVDEPWPGGITLEDGKRIARILEDTGEVDYLSVDACLEPQQEHIMTAPLYAPQGHMVYSAAAIKEVVESIPVLAVGRIVDPLHAEKILADGHADLIGMTRAQIADPELANKAREGRLDDIRTCLGDNENCRGRAQYGIGIACTGNPAVGREKDLGIGTLQPAAVKKTVVVVGGGPGGMEAARVAALRGHRVILYERGEALGGQVNLAARLPGRDEIGGIARWLKGQLAKLGVEVHLREEADAARVREARPDVVLVATGAAFFRNGLSGQTFYPIPGWEQEHVTTPEEVLSGRKTAGQHVVIVDGTGFVIGLALGEWLANQGKSVEVVTSELFVGPLTASTSQLPWIYARVAPILKLRPSTLVKEISGRTVKAINTHTRQELLIDDVDTVVLATAKEPNDALYRDLMGSFGEIYRVGDCDHAANGVSGIGDAIRSGHRIGRAI